MPKMSPEQRAALEQQLAEDDQAEDESDFEIEIWNGDGDGARLPFSKGKAYLARFGIEIEPPSAGGTDPSNGASASPQGDNSSRTSQRYFGRRSQSPPAPSNPPGAPAGS